VSGPPRTPARAEIAHRVDGSELVKASGGELDRYIRYLQQQRTDNLAAGDAALETGCQPGAVDCHDSRRTDATRLPACPVEEAGRGDARSGQSNGQGEGCAEGAHRRRYGGRSRRRSRLHRQ